MASPPGIPRNPLLGLQSAPPSPRFLLASRRPWTCSGSENSSPSRFVVPPVKSASPTAGYAGFGFHTQPTHPLPATCIGYPELGSCRHTHRAYAEHPPIHAGSLPRSALLLHPPHPHARRIRRLGSQPMPLRSSSASAHTARSAAPLLPRYRAGSHFLLARPPFPPHDHPHVTSRIHFRRVPAAHPAPPLPAYGPLRRASVCCTIDPLLDRTPPPFLCLRSIIIALAPLLLSLMSLYYLPLPYSYLPALNIFRT